MENAHCVEGESTFKELLSAIMAATPIMLDLLPGTIDAAYGDFEINAKEKGVLLRLVTAQRNGDHEAVRSTLLEHDANFLTAGDRGQASIEHVDRQANQRAHSCSYLQWDTHEQCAKCTKNPRGYCTEQCPVRDAEEAAQAETGEPAEMVA